MNLQIKLNLTRLHGSFVHSLRGGSGVVKKCLVIPLEGSGLVIESGNVYIKASAFEMKNPKHQTHICKLSIDIEKYTSLTEAERNDLPIIGGIHEFGTKKEK